MKIVLIGQGNVATSLHAVFAAKGIDAPMVSSWDLVNGVGEPLPQADVYIYAVKDEALADVVRAVHVSSRAIHVHTSGTVPATVFGDDKPHSGILYPFQTFSKAQPIDDFSDIPLFIEGKNIDDVAAIYTLALTLSPRVIEASQQDRERLHVAGVFANNFTNCMYRMAADILKGTQIPFSTLLPLIDQTAAKVHTLAPKDAQTGPAIRGDENVIRHHLELLSDTPRTPKALSEVYRLLTEYIQAQDIDK
ncbi:MAG: DUF2520 domain-containing protein [Paludibacteraceae bacterium]|nr:DUF2520 domain-containing protein [Paludibacteraceae bacterium]